MKNKLWYSRVIRMAFFSGFATILLAACVTVQKNYLGIGRDINNQPVQEFRPLTNQERKNLNENTDSLLQTIASRKKQKKALKASEINQLYSGFGKQLDHDRYYNLILQKNCLGIDSLKGFQFFAALQLLSSAAAYDSSYQKNRIVRRALNRGESGNHIPKRVLQKSQNYLYSPSVRKEIAKQNVEYYSPQNDRLLASLPKTNSFKALYKRIYRNNDRFHALMYGTSHAGSYAVGNSVGFFHGASYRKRNAELLIPYLQPFDIIMMKSPHHLTDKLVPGYFGHAAIWLGPELTKGIVSGDDQKSDKQKSGISEKSLVETLRTGVKVSSLEEFADGEDFLVLRLNELSENQKETILNNINKQLQKDYDFNFDIESPEALSCTELIFLTYDFIDWQVRYTWSRYTISPDDLPSTALKNEKFEFPVFIQNETVHDNPEESFIRSLTGLPDR